MSEYKKPSKSCVVLNIFADCEKSKGNGNHEKDYDGSKENYDEYKEKEDKTCVRINVFAKCEDGSYKESTCGKSYKKEKINCVEVNIYADCEEENYNPEDQY